MRVLNKCDGLSATCLVLVSLALTLSVIAQTLSPGEVRLTSRPYAPQSTIRVQTRMVELEVVVRDSHGLAVPGLTKEDFIVYDSNKSRDIAAFSVDSHNVAVNTRSKPPNSQPNTSIPPIVPGVTSPTQPVSNGRWIVLLFDDINTPPGDLAHAKIAATRFIKEAAATGDRIAVFATSGAPMQNFINDAITILAAISRVQSHLRMSPSGLAQCPRINAYEAFQIVNNDPSALKAKVAEACHCGGNANCEVEDLMGSELILPTSGSSGSPYGGAGALSTVVDSVHAQALQTWDQERLISQTTLDVIRVAVNQLANRPGTRMLLLASSGFLSGTLDQEHDAITNEAVRAGIVINSIDAKGLYAEAPGGPINESNELTDIPISSTVFQIQSLGDRLESADSALARFAESTGGQLFRNNNDLDLGFYQLGVVPATTYLLGFPPAEDGKYHKIKVELKNANRRFVQVRPGYFAPSNAANAQPDAADNIDAEVRGSTEKTDLPATSTEKLGTAASGSPQVTIQTHIDIQKLPFQEQKDRNVQKLTFVAALFDLQGKFITGKQAEMELALKPESFDRFSRTGINGVMQLEAPSGAYRLRMVVQEAVSGKMSAATKELQIP